MINKKLNTQQIENFIEESFDVINNLNSNLIERMHEAENILADVESELELMERQNKGRDLELTMSSLEEEIACYKTKIEGAENLLNFKKRRLERLENKKET